MSSEERTEKIDEVLDVLTKPLSRYILSVLAGVDPGVFPENSPATENNYHEYEDENP